MKTTVSRRLLLSMVALPCSVRPAAADPGAAGWTAALDEQVRRLAASTRGRFGLYVKRLDSGQAYAYQADRPWYLGSSTKLPMAIAVLQAIEAGRLAPGRRGVLRESDTVDGSGPLVWQAAGGGYGIDTLLRRMLMASDNTAANLLVRTLGAPALAESVRGSLGPGVTLTDFTAVRRDVYAELWPQARELPNRALVEIAAAPVGPQRLRALQRRLGPEAGATRVPDFDAAYARYYARGLNSATLLAYGGMLERLVRGELLPADRLPGLYRDLKFDSYDAYRLEAGLPRERRFIHKTGTQHRRACHMGVVDPQDGGRDAVVVAACAEDMDEHRDAAPLFEALGRAIALSALHARSN